MQGLWLLLVRYDSNEYVVYLDKQTDRSYSVTGKAYGSVSSTGDY